MRVPTFKPSSAIRRLWYHKCLDRREHLYPVNILKFGVEALGAGIITLQQ